MSKLYQHRILERSLPYSCLGKAFRSAANLRETSAPDNGLLTFSHTVTFASFLPQDPFSNYLYFNNSSYLHLTDFHSCMTFSHYRFAHLFLAEHTSESIPSIAAACHIYLNNIIYTEKQTTSKYTRLLHLFIHMYNFTNGS